MWRVRYHLTIMFFRLFLMSNIHLFEIWWWFKLTLWHILHAQQWSFRNQRTPSWSSRTPPPPRWSPPPPGPSTPSWPSSSIKIPGEDLWGKTDPWRLPSSGLCRAQCAVQLLSSLQCSTAAGVCFSPLCSSPVQTSFHSEWTIVWASNYQTDTIWNIKEFG